MNLRFILRKAENVQKHPCLIFPIGFGFGHSYNIKMCYITCPFWGFQPKNLVQNSLNHQHCLLFNSPVHFLLTDGLFSRLPHQTLLIRIHEPPETVEEVLHHLYRACVKTYMHDFLYCIKPVLVNIPIPILSPSPVL